MTLPVKAGLFQNATGDILDRPVGGNEGSVSPADLDIMLDRIVAALTQRPIKLRTPMVIEWYGSQGPAIIIKADTNAKAQGLQVVRKNGEHTTLGVGLETVGVVASYLQQREAYRPPGDVAAQKSRRNRTNEDDPGTGYGRTGFGTGKADDDIGNDSARPGELYETDFNAQYLRQNTGVFMAEGVLTTDLDAASDGKTGATTATMTMWVRDEASTTDPIALKDGDSITVVNRDETLSVTAPRYMKVIKIQNEWRPYWVACAE